MFACLNDPFQCFVDSVPPWAWWALTACGFLLAVGIALNLSTIAKGVAGWWGVAAVVGAVVTVFAVIWPRQKPKPTVVYRPDPPPAAPKKKKRTSILGRSLFK